jgi:pilus assembly protein Flp/PilA
MAPQRIGRSSGRWLRADDDGKTARSVVRFGGASAATGFGGTGDRVTKFLCRVHLAVSRLQDQEGATAVEYALMLALIAMVIVGAVAFLGRSTSNAFTSMTFSAP